MHSNLRQKIVEKFGAPVSAPKDCDRLASEVKAATGRSISSTTLRRFFGLLHSTSGVSRYTLDTLAIYCGAADYAGFMASVPPSADEGEARDVQIAERLVQVTRFTTKSIERKSLGGFDHTIPRADLQLKLNEFLESTYSVFPLIAPGGYGKSIALVHWVRTLPESYLCLLCGAGLFQAMLGEKKSMRDPMRLRLDDPQNIFEAFRSMDGEGERRLVIVIDALDELSGDPESMLELIDYLFDAATIYAKNPSVKFIFSLRESTWSIYVKNRVEKIEASRWFEEITPLLESGYTNLPRLSNPEIREIISLYNREVKKPLIFECISWDIREMMKVPILLHFISRLFRNLPSLENLTQIDITREFLNEFLFNSKYAEEKEDLVWKVLELMDRNGDNLPVAKSMLKDRFPIHLKRETGYYRAWQELQHDGILIEERKENAYGIHQTTVGFRHQNLYFYLYALYLIRENGGMSPSLFENVAQLGKHKGWIAEIIAVLYLITYQAQNLEALTSFCSLPESLLGSLPVRLTVGASFRIENQVRNRVIEHFAGSVSGRRFFFEQYVDTNYLFNNFTLRVKEYLKHTNGPEALLFGNSIFYLAAFLKMDAAACRNFKTEMDLIDPDEKVHPWPIGRKVFTQYMHTVFVEGKGVEELPQYLNHFRHVAYRHPGYLQKGLIEFEMYIMLALVFTRDFKGLYGMLDRISRHYNMDNPDYEGAAFLKNNQNSIPLFFMEYAIYKLNYQHVPGVDLIWQGAIDKYTTNYDDYLYLLLLKWFLVDYYTEMSDDRAAMEHYASALDLARFAGYTFVEAFLLVNHPLKDPDRIEAGEQMIRKSGFAREAFNFPFGPCASP